MNKEVKSEKFDKINTTMAKKTKDIGSKDDEAKEEKNVTFVKRVYKEKTKETNESITKRLKCTKKCYCESPIHNMEKDCKEKLRTLLNMLQRKIEDFLTQNSESCKTFEEYLTIKQQNFKNNGLLENLIEYTKKPDVRKKETSKLKKKIDIPSEVKDSKNHRSISSSSEKSYRKNSTKVKTNDQNRRLNGNFARDNLLAMLEENTGVPVTKPSIPSEEGWIQSINQSMKQLHFGRKRKRRVDHNLPKLHKKSKDHK